MSRAPGVLTGFTVDPHPAQTFKKNQKELAQDLIIKEQQIEFLISSLPGIGSSEEAQEKRIRELEGELAAAEEERRKAVAEKEVVLQRLDEVIRSIKRP
jgi:mediator of RNA polymerase II transcription subunit 21